MDSGRLLAGREALSISAGQAWVVVKMVETPAAEKVSEQAEEPALPVHLALPSRNWRVRR